MSASLTLIRTGIVLLSLALAGCEMLTLQEDEPEQQAVGVVPDDEIDLDLVYLDRATSLWKLREDSSLVSGFVVNNYNDGSLSEKFGVLDGQKQGTHLKYYPDGRLNFLQNYADNRLHGKVVRWGTENGHQLLAHLSYENGKLHGEQRTWYATGELHKLMHMNAGREEGMQQAFRKNGALYANYEVRDGRIFGLKRSNLCYELDNEQIVYQP